MSTKSEITISTDFETVNGFTFCSDFRSFGVVRGLSPEAIASLAPLSEGFKNKYNINLAELVSIEKFIQAVTNLLLTAPGKNRIKFRYEALQSFVADGALITPMGSPSRLIKINDLIQQDIQKKFLKHIRDYYDLNDLSTEENNIIIRIFSSTIEGKNLELDGSHLEKFLRIYFKEDKNRKNNYSYKDGVTTRQMIGLKSLAGRLKCHELIQRNERIDVTMSMFTEKHIHSITWVTLFENYCRVKCYGSLEKVEYSFKKLCLYLYENSEIIPLENFFSRSIKRKSIADWLDERGGENERTLRDLRNFLEWVSSNDERISIADQFAEIPCLRPDFYIPISLSDIGSSSNGKEKPAETVQLALPLEYLEEVAEILTENDMAWPKTVLNEWADLRNSKTGKQEKIFCPVLPNLLLFLLKLPARHVQARRLDSGEGDLQTFDLEKLEFKQNTGLHVGYWKRAGVNNIYRGVLRKISDTWFVKVELIATTLFTIGPIDRIQAIILTICIIEGFTIDKLEDLPNRFFFPPRLHSNALIFANTSALSASSAAISSMISCGLR